MRGWTFKSTSPSDGTYLSLAVAKNGYASIKILANGPQVSTARFLIRSWIHCIIVLYCFDINNLGEVHIATIRSGFSIIIINSSTSTAHFTRYCCLFNCALLVHNTAWNTFSNFLYWCSACFIVATTMVWQARKLNTRLLQFTFPVVLY